MDPLTCSESTRKVNLEEMSKDDLLKKCYHLINIAQKAKQTKNALQEENNRLKDELSSKLLIQNSATQEIIDKLTQQKLSLVTSLDNLKEQNDSLLKKLGSCEKELKTCQEELYLCDNERSSYQRQNNRLTEENDQLLTNLDSLEKQIEKLNQIGTEQQKELLELEKIRTQESRIQHDESTTTELQRMLTVSLEEVKRLKSENNSFISKIENMQISLSEKDKNILLVSEELMSKNDTIDNLTKELNNDDFSVIKKDCEIQTLTLEEVCSQTEHIRSLEDSNNRLKDKLKLYHSKIIKFAGIAKNLREDKDKILHLSTSYTEQVKEWKEQLNLAQEKLIKYIDVTKTENHLLKTQLSELESNQKSSVDVLLKEKLCLEAELRDKIYLCDELKIMQKKGEEETTLLNQKLSEINNICTDLRNELGECQKSIQKYEIESEKLRTDDENNTEFKKLKEIEIRNLELAHQESIEHYKREIQALKVENEVITEEVNKLKEMEVLLNKNLENNSKCIDEYKIKLDESLMGKDNVIRELNDLKNQLMKQENELLLLKEENTSILKSKQELVKEIHSLNSEKKSFNVIIKESNEQYNKLVEDNQKKISNYEKLVTDLKNQIKSSEELGNRSSEEITKLVEENKALSVTNEALDDKLRELERLRSCSKESQCQTEDHPIASNELEQQVIDLKRENAELLSEMNEMNQAIKERGENISKLQAHCEEVIKKLQIYETQANKNIDNITEKEKIIEHLTKEIEAYKSNKNNDRAEEINNLRSEIDILKEKLNSNLDSSYAENETMSTSTISRSEEINRLKDLEGSWEERYGKLRTLAVKLKGKIRELTNSLTSQQNENQEMQKKLSNNIKTIQNLQNQSDRLEDDLEKSKQECKQYLNRLNTIANDISKDKNQLASKDDTISELKQQLDGLINEKQETENWKKQISVKVQALRKEVEANNVLKKDFELRIAKLSSELEAKEQALKTEIENHKQTANLLDQSNNECKKNSVLNLEMQDYERSVKETSKKLEKQQEQVNKLKGQVESQKTTIEALREQNKLLEERVNNEEQNLITVTSEIDTYKSKILKLEDESQQKDAKIHSVTQLLETSRSEKEELSTELSKVIAEHQKANGILKNERDHLRSQNLGLQQSLREVQDDLKMKTDELKVIHKDYEGYKIRAQSVLRQNQARDVGLEERLSEEIASLTAQNTSLTKQLCENKERIVTLEALVDEMTSDKESYQKHIKELDTEIADLKTQYAQLAANHEKIVSENAETIRSLKVHADTLSQCFRQQLSEQETRHDREVIELKSLLDKVPTPTETSPVLLTMPREEGEGSESIESNLTSTHPVPLERLLGSDSDQSTERIKKQLGEQESKVAHLTALLSDTEKDLIKHVQMNDLLKEEIRRHQRSVEREKHAENLEYLKNVVFKFVTLNNGDERSRLVPVLNTILKLSPEETKQLNVVAKGESGLKGWSNYLPTWPSPGRPQ